MFDVSCMMSEDDGEHLRVDAAPVGVAAAAFIPKSDENSTLRDGSMLDEIGP